ncbi:YkvA family protein [Roseivirga sp.]|uniref:YkvA family protein n=1 Tax=Roseivirga sp. TaxID=1964215 RepID=UPI003B5234E4
MARTEPNATEKRFFNRFKDKAMQIVGDSSALKNVLVKVQDKLDRMENDDSLKGKIVAYLNLIIRMVSNSVSGAYPDMPWQTMVMIIAGLLYFIAPLDALPDFIPVAGLLDDATILAWLGKSFKDDLSRYKEWEEVNLSR